MAAPAWVQSSAGSVIATGSAAVTLASTTAGNLIIVQAIADGTGATALVTVAAGSNVENLAGTDDAINSTSGITGAASNNQVGNPAAAYQKLYFARSLGGTVTVTAEVGGSGDDVYVVIHEFSGVHTGTTFSDILENGSVATLVNGFGTSTSVADSGVTTLGSDRLALNFVAINDDATGIAAFAGASGGTWAMPKSYETATGTDATLSLMTAEIASAGTIDGGADTITSDGWGVLGFALIPAAAAAPTSYPFPSRPAPLRNL